MLNPSKHKYRYNYTVLYRYIKIIFSKFSVTRGGNTISIDVSKCTTEYGTIQHSSLLHIVRYGTEIMSFYRSYLKGRVGMRVGKDRGWGILGGGIERHF